MIIAVRKVMGIMTFESFASKEDIFKEYLPNIEYEKYYRYFNAKI